MLILIREVLQLPQWLNLSVDGDTLPPLAENKLGFQTVHENSSVDCGDDFNVPVMMKN